MKKLLKKRKKQPKKRKITEAMTINGFIDFSEPDVDSKTIKVKDGLTLKEYYVGAISILGIDIFHYSEQERERCYRSFAAAEAALEIPHKYIFTDLSPDLSKQKDFLTYKSKQSSGYIKYQLEKRIDEYTELENNHRDRLVYLIFYTDTKQKLLDGIDMYTSSIGYVQTEQLDISQLAALLHKTVSLNSDSDRKLINNDLNKFVFPDKVEFSQNHFKVNDRYATTFVVHSYPAFFSDLTFASYILQNSDVIITLDLEKRDREVVKQEVSKSMNELRSRSEIKQNVSDIMDTRTEFDKMQDLYDSIANGNEQVYNVTFRFIILDAELASLETKVKKLKKILQDDGMHGFVPINKMQDEYLHLLLPGTKICTPFPLYDTLSRQYPLYYQQQIDSKGMYFGKTETGGLVLLNTFTRTNKRPSYDLLALGVKGSGKSITLKTMLEDQLLLGNKVMVLDIESEYGAMAELYGGQVVRMTSSSSINPLQLSINVVAEAENSESLLSMTEEEARQSNFLQELSRIETFFVQLNPDSNDDELRKLSELVRKAYERKNIYPTTSLDELSPNDFPVFSDVYKLCETAFSNADNDFDKAVLARLMPKLRQLCKGGRYEIFDCHTNIDIYSSTMIVYDVKQLSEMDDKIYNAQLFNILSLMWAEICKNVAVNKGVINPYDRRNVIALIDEAHRFISEHNPRCTEFIEKLVRRSRKYFAGLWFATQSILDFFPDGAESKSALSDKIKVIFQLVQYKILLKQDSSSVSLLGRIFTQFTLSELNSTTDFEPGEMLMALDTARNKIHCTRRATLLNLIYMGNSDDIQTIFNKLFADRYIENNNESGLTESDLGYQLAMSKELCQTIAEEFSYYVYQRFNFDSKVSPLIDKIIMQSINALIISLIKKSEVE